MTTHEDLLDSVITAGALVAIIVVFCVFCMIGMILICTVLGSLWEKWTAWLQHIATRSRSQRTLTAKTHTS